MDLQHALRDYLGEISLPKRSRGLPFLLILIYLGISLMENGTFLHCERKSTMIRHTYPRDDDSEMENFETQSLT